MTSDTKLHSPSTVGRTVQIQGRIIAHLPLGEHDALDFSAVQERSEELTSLAPDVIVFTRGTSSVLTPYDSPAPGAGGCYRCFERSWQLLRGESERNALELGPGNAWSSSSDLPWEGPSQLWIDSILQGILSAGRTWPTSSSGLTNIFHVDALKRSVSTLPLIAESDCERCDLRVADRRADRPVILSPSIKPSAEATRVRSVSDLCLETEAYANPLAGMLGTSAGRALDSTTTAPVTGYTRIRGVHSSLHEFFWSGHADDFEQSTALGILEGLERHAGLSERRIYPSVIGSYSEMLLRREESGADYDVLDPRSVELYPDRFYELIGPRFTQFTDDLKIPWVWGHKLPDGRDVLVPHTFVYYMSQDHSINFLQECSNGCATGGSREEAILYGLLELIERDAFLIGWYAKGGLPEIDVSTVTSRSARLMVNRLGLMGYDVRLFDNRVDFAVPCVTAVAVRRDGKEGTLCFAAGAALDPEDAVRAALCEIASYVPGFPQRVLDNMDYIHSMNDDFYQVRELKHHALLYGTEAMRPYADHLLEQDAAPRSMDDLFADWGRARPRSLDLTDELVYVLSMLTDAGFEPIFVDQSSPHEQQLGLHTVATIVPGLVPIDFGWTMQRALTMSRVRTAPVAAGWAERPLTRDQLNLVPHPFP